MRIYNDGDFHPWASFGRGAGALKRRVGLVGVLAALLVATSCTGETTDVSGTGGSASGGADAGSGGSVGIGTDPTPMPGWLFFDDEHGWEILGSEGLSGSPTLITVENAGNPTVGALQLTIPFDGMEQTARAGIALEVPMDFSGRSPSARLWAKSGKDLRGRLYLESGDDAVRVTGAWADLSADWIIAEIDADEPATPEAGFDSADVRTLGVEITSGNAGGSATVIIDTVATDGILIANESIIKLPMWETWWDGNDNQLGIQGAATFESVFDIQYDTFESQHCFTGNTDFCEEGTSCAATIRFDLCAEGPAPGSHLHTLGDCPWASVDLGQELAGFRVFMEGLPPYDTALAFVERDRSNLPSVVVEDSTVHFAIFARALVDGAIPERAVDVAQLEAVQLSLPGGGVSRDFDFCFEIAAIVHSASDPVPNWVRVAGPGATNEFRGVNLAGAEFGTPRGEYGMDYIYPTRTEVEYFASTGMNLIRLPFHWENLQPTLGGEFELEEMNRISEVIEAANENGMAVLIDPHNYARYDDQVLGGGAVTSADFADFWSRLATSFIDNDQVIFGLMNEPHDMPGDDWLDAANAAIAAIRGAGATQLIAVPGVDWTSAHRWTEVNSTLMAGLVDPADNFVFEVHQYFNHDNSGVDTDPCVSETIGSERLSSFTAWARDAGHRAILGEFGAGTDETCLLALDDMMAHLADNADVYLGWTYWAAGPWWHGYGFSVEPTWAWGPKPQMQVLQRYLLNGEQR